MPIDPNAVQWDAPPQTVGKPVTGAVNEPLRGGVILPGKPEKPEKPDETFRELTAEEKKARGINPEAVYQISGTTGKVSEVQAPKALTEGESKAVDFYQRTRRANTELDRFKLPPEGYLGLIGQQYAPTITAALSSDERNAARAAVEDFIAATLRRESGASIAPSEFDRQYRIFFPTPGAGPEEIEAKRQARELAIRGLKAAAGKSGAEQAEKNLMDMGFIDAEGKPIITAAKSETAAGAGPAVSVSQEESIAAFGQPAYDEKGNLVGRAYQQTGGTIYDAQGNELGLTGAVTQEELQQPAPSFIGGVVRDVGEAITGSERATPTTEALPDWTNMPEMQQLLSMPAFKASLGTMFGGGPQEIAQIVQSNFPGTQVYQDEKGNYILQSPSTGQRYAIKPGFQVSDIPRAIGGVLLGAGGRGATVAGTAIREAGLQAGIEGTQAATGGTFNPEDVAMAGAIGAGGQKIAEIAPQALQRLRALRGGGGAPSAPVAPVGGAPELPGGITLPGSGVTPAPAAAPSVAPVVPPTAPTIGGTRGTAGAMSASEEAIRAQRAAELPVPIELARFQRTRNFVEQQRARELAKNNEVGGPIRERMAQQQDALRQNFERFIEGTGSQVWENPYEQGGVIANALSTLAKRERTKINALYKRADAAGETMQPVSYQDVIAFVNEQTPTTREKLAPVLNAVREQILKNDPTGSGTITLKQMEDVRKLINKAAQPGTPDAAFGKQLKDIIDSSTEGAGGDIYKSARAARAKYAQDFENIDLVQKVFDNKPGTAERYVALEQVTNRITGTNTPLDSVNHLLGLLDRAGPRGERAKRELQGALMEKIRDQAYRGVTRDEAGGTVIQPAALNRIISDLDRTGKLDAIFDKKTAELLRTVNDVTKDIVTAPPGSVNASGTSSAIMNAIDTVATFGTTGIPVPAAKILNEFRKAIANRQLRKEVTRLLD